MKILFNAFAVLALIATTAYGQDEPTEPLKCEVTEPKPYEVWQVGGTASTAWECETPNNRPLERMGPLYLYHIELGTGDDKTFKYVDTLDASAKIRDLRFDWILKNYPAGDNYVVRMISTLKSTRFPDSQTESDKLDWTYIYPISIVAEGDEEGLDRANERREEEGGAKGKNGAKGQNGAKGKDGDRKDAKNTDEADDSSAKDDDKTDGSETDGSGSDKSGAAGSDAAGGDAAGKNGTEEGAAGNGTDALGNSATSLLVGNSVLFAASAIAGVLVL